MSAYMLPSTDPQDALYEPRRYWRGPIWSVMNWTDREGSPQHAPRPSRTPPQRHRRPRRRVTGFYEYFDPSDGTGLGAPTSLDRGGLTCADDKQKAPPAKGREAFASRHFHAAGAPTLMEGRRSQ